MQESHGKVSITSKKESVDIVCHGSMVKSKGVINISIENCNGRVVDIDLTPLQFAMMMTSIDGNPIDCTIKHVGDMALPAPAIEPTKSSLSKSLFSKLCESIGNKDLSDKMAETIQNVADEAAQKILDEAKANIQHIFSTMRIEGANKQITR